jgi:hypothetical protein
MVLPFLVLFLGLQDNSQQFAELNRLRQDVQRLSSELNRTQTVLQNELRPVCSSESRLQTGELRITSADAPVRANLFGMVSTPSESCLPADIRISATYFDSSGAFVCSGTATITQTSHVQNTLFQFHPYELEVFLKWWDGPTLKQQTLICRDYQGNEMRSPADSSASLRIYATIFPKRGGLSTSEMQLTLPRLPRRD